MESFDDVKKLKPELQTALLNFLLALADTKRALGLRYAEWCDTAPRLEAGVAASAMAQDQLGQARVLYGLIQEQFPQAARSFDDEARAHTHNLAYLDKSFPNWATFVAANLLIGSGVTVVEEALADSSFEPLDARMPKMVEEERFHRVHAEGWFKALQHSHHALNVAQAVEEILPQMLCWFGDAQHATLADEKILAAQPSELRERYLERVGPFIETSPARDLLRHHDKSGAWSYTGALPWGEYDPVTRRVKTST